MSVSVFRHLRRTLRRRLKRNHYLCGVFILTFILADNVTRIKTYVRLYGVDTVIIPDDANPADYGRFEPEVFTDFAEDADGRPRIERIIHQTWMDRSIPHQFMNNVRSFGVNNPTWKYFLWTDVSARKLITNHYPELLPVWDGFYYSKYTIRRADALRYIVLYHYGGVYSDLDTYNARPLEKAISKHACVFTPEPYEHAVIRAFVPFLLGNAVMLCSSGHPFLKHLIDNLHLTEHYENSVDSTGPGFVTSQYMSYNKLPRESDHLVLYHGRRLDDLMDTSPYFNKGDVTFPAGSNESVYIANTVYFMNLLDVTISRRMIETCSKWSEITYLTRRVCVNANVMGLNRKRHRFAFIEHQWYMTWMNWKFPAHESGTRQVRVHIRDIVPNCVIYGEEMEGEYSLSETTTI